MTLQIANHNIHRVLIDTGSSVDMLFALLTTKWVYHPLCWSQYTSLYGFFEHSVRPYGGVELLVTVGNHLAQAIVLNNFLIVDTSGVYNAIIRMSTLNTLWVVASTYHPALKFPTSARIRVAHKNQVEAHCCYALALKEQPHVHQKANTIGSTSSTSSLVNLVSQPDLRNLEDSRLNSSTSA